MGLTLTEKRSSCTSILTWGQSSKIAVYHSLLSRTEDMILSSKDTVFLSLLSLWNVAHSLDISAHLIKNNFVKSETNLCIFIIHIVEHILQCKSISNRSTLKNDLLLKHSCDILHVFQLNMKPIPDVSNVLQRERQKFKVIFA